MKGRFPNRCWAVVLVGLAFCNVDVLLAQAPEDAAPSVVSELSIEVRSPGLVDAGRLRDSLHEDLGTDIRIRVVSGDEPHANAHLIVEWASATLVVLRLRRGEEERRREVEVGTAAEERSVVLALLASNLLRDEADELIALLRARRRTERESETEPPEEPAPEPEVDPEVSAEPEEEEPEPEAAEEPTEPVDPNAPVDVFVGFDAAPFVGMSSYFRGRDTRELSFGLAGAWSGRIRGASFSGGVDITGGLRGLQVAGGFALVQGTGAGLQTAGAVSLALENFDGLQVAGVSATVLGRMRGVQTSSGLNITRGLALGAQLSIANYASELRGIQFGTLNLAGSVVGLQAGAANYANEVRGVQIGLLNVSSGYVHGLQLGIVNLADGADAGIGLINIYRNGRTQVRVGMDTAGFIAADVIHGSRITHTIYSLGVNPVDGRSSVAFGLGVGARASLSERVHLDFDVLSRVLMTTEGNDVRADGVLEPRIVLGVQLYKAIGAFVGLAYPIRFSGAEAPLDYSRLTTVLREAGVAGAFVDAWPSLSLGIELL